MKILKTKVHSDPYTFLNATPTQRITMLTPPLSSSNSRFPETHVKKEST